MRSSVPFEVRGVEPSVLQAAGCGYDRNAECRQARGWAWEVAQQASRGGQVQSSSGVALASTGQGSCGDRCSG